jgi:LasA protease
MPSNANKRPSLSHLIIFFLIIPLISFACTFSSLASAEPVFRAPEDPQQSTDTPQPVSSTPEVIDPEPTDAISIPVEPDPTATQPESTVNTAPFLYKTQAGDTLPAVAVRFGVQPSEIASPDPIPTTALLNPNQLLIIPRTLANTTSSQHLMPDSEVVFSPSAVDFDINAFVQQAGGYLSSYKEYLASTGWTSAADIIARVAIENSINPRLLLALLEYQSNWVYGQPADLAQTDYPMGKVNLQSKGLYHQLTWALNQLSIGYYDWREGRLTEIHFSDGVTARLAPDLNAGTAALQYFFAQLYDSQGWLKALDPQEGLPALHERMFGNPWVRALTVEPLYPPDLAQPHLILPFLVNQIWAYSGGPHGAWERDGARAAVDFAPGSLESGCVESDAWVVSSAAGLVVRSWNGIVVVDLDGDSREQTGWVLIYLHIATKGRIQKGEWVEAGDPIGHPSCEGGFSTGTHVHFARKYNGEWIAADGPLPFVLSGWTVHAGKNPYEGTLTRDGVTIPASQLGIFSSRIIRHRDDP